MRSDAAGACQVRLFGTGEGEFLWRCASYTVRIAYVIHRRLCQKPMPPRLRPSPRSSWGRRWLVALNERFDRDRDPLSRETLVQPLHEFVFDEVLVDKFLSPQND